MNLVASPLTGLLPPKERVCSAMLIRCQPVLIMATTIMKNSPQNKTKTYI
jgi:hypothetical protein